MVNTNFAIRTGQCWLLFCAMLLNISTSSLFAQNPYQNRDYSIYPAQQPDRVARRTTPPQPRTKPQPFRIDVANPISTPSQQEPFSHSPELEPPQSEALARAFTSPTAQPQLAEPTGRVHEIFGINTPEQAAEIANPFKKVAAPTLIQQDDPVQEKETAPASPFSEIAPSDPPIQQSPTPAQSPFNELTQDPNPIAPPMDTRPVKPQTQGTQPRLPRGAEFTPNPGEISPDPPIPGEASVVEKEEPNVINVEEPVTRETTQRNPEPDTEKPNRSVFNSNEDLDPVPAPATSRIYLPAKDPTDYAKRSEGSSPITYPAVDPRIMPNPYANLPGPYGYAQPPAGAYPPQYPAQYPPNMAMQAPMYGHCGPGCTPTSACGTCATCDGNSPATGNCGGCNACNQCVGSRPTLAGTSIGERIVETSEVCTTDCETYTDVVSECDSVCSNFASCYVSVFGGWSDLNDFVAQGNLGTGVYTENAGYLFGIAIGQIQGKNLRTELELSYRNINISGLTLNGSVPSQFIGVNGDFGTLSGMFNGYWEFVDVGTEKIKPYVGGGVGFALARPDFSQPNGLEAVINDNESSFAWQWMAGLNYKASPTLDAFVEYRYFAADSFRLDTEIPQIAGLGNGSGSIDYRSGSVLFGLRARF